MDENKEQSRVRIAYKVSAKGVFMPDVTSEAETVETAISNLRAATAEVKKFASEEGTLE